MAKAREKLKAERLQNALERKVSDRVIELKGIVEAKFQVELREPSAKSLVFPPWLITKKNNLIGFGFLEIVTRHDILTIPLSSFRGGAWATERLGVQIADKPDPQPLYFLIFALWNGEPLMWKYRESEKYLVMNGELGHEVALKREAFTAL